MTTTLTLSNPRRTLRVTRPVAAASPARREARTSLEPVQGTSTALARESDLARQEASALPSGSLDSAALFCGQKMIEILHNGFVYKLQATKLGKLILTK